MNNYLIQVIKVALDKQIHYVTQQSKQLNVCGYRENIMQNICMFYLLGINVRLTNIVDRIAPLIK